MQSDNGRWYIVRRWPADEIVCHRCRDREGKMGFDANAKTDFDANRFAFHIMINSRGVAYWTDGKDDKRIFFTAGSNTYAIDANTGKPISSFADSGYIDLHNDLGRDVHDLLLSLLHLE